MVGNYFPCWTAERCTYEVLGRWPEKLWKAHKLTHEVYEEYLFACRDGVLYRKRNFEARKEREEQQKARKEVEERVKRIRGNPALYQPFPEVPEARAWLETFKHDALRYQVLVVLGESRSGKTEWAQSLFKRPLTLKIGQLEHFPEGVREFKRGCQDGLVLDDLRDLKFLVAHQDKLQGKYTGAVEFASTPGGQLSYQRALPVVATANYSTANLQLLEKDDFLGNPGNWLLLHWPRPVARPR